MKDAGDLRKLPPEVRKEIYTYSLVENKRIPIKRFLRAKSKRKYDTTALRLDTKRSSGVVRVNKLMNEEAVPVLYGYNKFEFLNAVALYHFLQQLSDAKRHLRHVSIHQNGLMFMKSWKLMQQSIQILASVKGLRSLEVSHSALCRNGTPKTSLKDFVQYCKPLLRALNVDFLNKGLRLSVLDIIKIVLPCSFCERSPRSCSVEREHSWRALVTDYGTKMSRKMFSELQCGCHCRNGYDVNNGLNQELKKEIAKQLKLNTR